MVGIYETRGADMWMKLKCEKCGTEKYIVDKQNWTKKQEEKAKTCPCGEKMKVVAEDD